MGTTDKTRLQTIASERSFLSAQDAQTVGPEPPSSLVARPAVDDDRDWIKTRRTKAPRSKKTLGDYTAAHLLEAQQMVELGSGTQLYAVMNSIVDRRIKDLQILTNNLQVLAKGRAAKDLGAMNIILIGGTLNTSLDCTSGPTAAEGVRSRKYKPQIVIFGAIGVSFLGGLSITYAFEDEESVQVAFATRPTDRRVLLFDHTKLGKTFGKTADITIAQMLHDARECLLISTYPDEGDPDLGDETLEQFEQRLATEEVALKVLLDEYLARETDPRKNFVFRLINSSGGVHRERSLADLRAGKWA